jgi:uncharacterized membrane protein (UPF0127 family)
MRQTGRSPSPTAEVNPVVRMRYRALVLIALGLIAAGTLAGLHHLQTERESERRLIRLAVGGVVFDAEVSDTVELQSQGLSGRSTLAEREAMLFVFERPLRHAFSMRGMRFAIDIIWIDQDGIVSEITPRVEPATYPQIFQPQRPVKYVLEINAGLAEARGISAGDRLEFPPGEPRGQ